MRAQLKYLLNLENLQYLQEYLPEKNDDFGFYIRCVVGEVTLGGEESFDIFLCTPKWFLKNCEQSEIIFGRHYLIVLEYNYPRIYERLRSYIDSTHGTTWDEIGLKLGHIGHWEFEDYREKI